MWIVSIAAKCVSVVADLQPVNTTNYIIPPLVMFVLTRIDRS
jgi:hypothetical protein